eukprot:12900327-Prorocentrum_lima.AAC.1
MGSTGVRITHQCSLDGIISEIAHSQCLKLCIHSFDSVPSGTYPPMSYVLGWCRIMVKVLPNRFSLL